MPLLIVDEHAPVRRGKQVGARVAVAVCVGAQAKGCTAAEKSLYEALIINRAVVVAIEQQERIAEAAERRAQARARFVFHRRHLIADVYAKARAIAKGVHDFFGQIAQQQHDLFNAERPDLLEQVLQERLALERIHRLGLVVGKRPQARAGSAGQDDGLADGGKGGISHCERFLCRRKYTCIVP